MADRAEAQPRHRSDVLGDAEQILDVGFTVEGDPAYAEVLGGRGQPQVLDG
ncbi:MAG: hypothetical protein QOE61_3040 [Micromonosporaceae bacterium]|nr:hypothetical protein [Micromonosporaceae bacterium]